MQTPTPPSSPPSSTLLVVRDAAQMQAVGESLAPVLRLGDLVLLEGELGAGKTTLAQGLARGLGAPTLVTSPTFVLMIEHHTPRGPLLHLDAYRLEGLSFEEARQAGLEEFFNSPDAIRLVEWPSMIPQWIDLYAREDATWQVRIEHVIEHVIEHADEARQVQVLAPLGREWKWEPSANKGPMRTR